jgi:hypothetical protein
MVRARGSLPSRFRRKVRALRRVKSWRCIVVAFDGNGLPKEEVEEDD